MSTEQLGAVATASPTTDRTRPARVAPPEVLRTESLGSRILSTLRIVTVAGWCALALAVLSWVLGWWFGWQELVFLATAAAVCLLISVGFLFGSNTLRVEVEVAPRRVVVGQRSAGQLVVTNPSSRRTTGSRIELSVGDGSAEFGVPSLAGHATHEELFVLPTERRGIIPVGPATSVNGDPLGLLRRSVPRTEALPLFVHPRTVPLGHLGAGFMRDLEGQPTADLSPSDIAFHALRDYAPGDDRRFVHWMTTARVGKLMVRQFTDTRRAHLAVVVDGSRRSYADGTAEVCDEFEVAVAVAGSLGIRAISDEQDLTMMVAGRNLHCVNGPRMLDGLAGVVLGEKRSTLSDQVDRMNRTASGVSLAIVITGSRTSIADLRGATMRFSTDVRTVAIRIDPMGETGFRPVGSALVLTVASLDELALLLWAVTQS